MVIYLYSVDVGSEYGSFVLRHAVYVKNRLPHTYIKKTIYEALTGINLDIIDLRTVGCRLHVKNSGNKKNKLDHHSSTGIFFGYIATTKNAYYIYDTAYGVKIRVHALFDGSCFTSPQSETSLAAQTLQ